MQITKLVIENFLSFGPKQVLDLTNAGLVFVEGENQDDSVADNNGSGKSVLPEALTWGLTGRTLRGLKADEVIHRAVGKNCHVKVKGVHNGQKWLVWRYRKYDKKSGVVFEVNGKDLTCQGDPDETQRRINQYLGIDFSTFTSSVVFGQGERWRFSELTDAERKAVLDRLLGIESLERALEFTRKKRKELQTAIEYKHYDVEHLGNDIETTKQALEEAEKFAEREQQQQKVNFLKRKVEITKELVKLRSQIGDNLALDIKRVTENKRKADAAREKIKEKLLVVEKKISTVEAEMQSTEHKLNELLQVEKESKNLGSKCRLCGSSISASTHREHMSSLRGDITKIKANISDLIDELHNTTWEKKDLEKQENDAYKSVLRFELKLRDLREQDTEYAKKSARISALKQERARVEEAEKETQSKKISTEKFEKRIKKLVQEKKEKEAELRKLAHEEKLYEFWVQGFGNAGIKSHLLDHVMPVLNQRAQEFSQNLMGDLVVQFGSQSKLKSGELRDKIDIEVQSTHGADSYKGSSKGEKQKIDIVIARTLQSLDADRHNTACNVVWWDEVWEGLDSGSCEAVMNFMQAEAKTRSSVFVISHLEGLRENFPRVLRVIKENGFSRLEWQ